MANLAIVKLTNGEEIIGKLDGAFSELFNHQNPEISLRLTDPRSVQIMERGNQVGLMLAPVFLSNPDVKHIQLNKGQWTICTNEVPADLEQAYLSQTSGLVLP